MRSTTLIHIYQHRRELILVLIQFRLQLQFFDWKYKPSNLPIFFLVAFGNLLWERWYEERFVNHINPLLTLSLSYAFCNEIPNLILLILKFVNLTTKGSYTYETMIKKGLVGWLLACSYYHWKMADRYSVISYHSSVELQYLFIVVFMLHGKKRKMGTFDFGENFIASLKVWVLGSRRNMYPRFPWGLVNTHHQTLPTSSKRYDQILF